MLWPVAALIVVGTIPGVVAGSLARVYLLPDPRNFKLFMGLVLLFIGGRLAKKVFGATPPRAAPADGSGLQVRVHEFILARVDYESTRVFATGCRRVALIARRHASPAAQLSARPSLK